MNHNDDVISPCPLPILSPALGLLEPNASVKLEAELKLNVNMDKKPSTLGFEGVHGPGCSCLPLPATMLFRWQYQVSATTKAFDVYARLMRVATDSNKTNSGPTIFTHQIMDPDGYLPTIVSNQMFEKLSRSALYLKPMDLNGFKVWYIFLEHEQKWLRMDEARKRYWQNSSCLQRIKQHGHLRINHSQLLDREDHCVTVSPLAYQCNKELRKQHVRKTRPRQIMCKQEDACFNLNNGVVPKFNPKATAPATVTMKRKRKSRSESKSAPSQRGPVPNPGAKQSAMTHKPLPKPKKPRKPRRLKNHTPSLSPMGLPFPIPPPPSFLPPSPTLPLLDTVTPLNFDFNPVDMDFNPVDMDANAKNEVPPTAIEPIDISTIDVVLPLLEPPTLSDQPNTNSNSNSKPSTLLTKRAKKPLRPACVKRVRRYARLPSPVLMELPTQWSSRHTAFLFAWLLHPKAEPMCCETEDGIVFVDVQSDPTLVPHCFRGWFTANDSLCLPVCAQRACVVQVHETGLAISVKDMVEQLAIQCQKSRSEIVQSILQTLSVATDAVK